MNVPLFIAEHRNQNGFLKLFFFSLDKVKFVTSSVFKVLLDRFQSFECSWSLYTMDMRSFYPVFDAIFFFFPFPFFNFILVRARCIY